MVEVFCPYFTFGKEHPLVIADSDGSTLNVNFAE